MLANAQQAQRFVAGIDLAAFLVNEEKVYATIRALEILGEASKKIPRSVR